MPQDVGPNLKLNAWIAILIAMTSALPLYFGLNSLTFLPPGQRSFSYTSLGIAAAIIVFALWVWRRPPINTAMVTFREGGFRLATRRPFLGRRQFDLGWAEIENISHYNGGAYGGRSFIIRSRTQGNASFGAAWVDVSSAVVLERFTLSATAAGFELEKTPLSLASVLRTRWKVRPVA